MTVFTVSGSVHPSCCRLVSWMSLNYYSKSALHVSGNIFAHHQEHLTIFTVSGNVHPNYCLLVSAWTPAGSNLGEHYRILQIQSSVPDDGRKYRPKRVELTWNNKLTYTVASCWLFSLLYHDAQIHERQVNP